MLLYLYTNLLSRLSRGPQILNYVGNCSFQLLTCSPALNLFVCLKAIHGVSWTKEPSALLASIKARQSPRVRIFSFTVSFVLWRHSVLSSIFYHPCALLMVMEHLCSTFWPKPMISLKAGIASLVPNGVPNPERVYNKCVLSGKNKRQTVRLFFSTMWIGSAWQ